MAIIWTHAPYFKNNLEYEKFVLWSDSEENMQTGDQWVAIEVIEDVLYINGINEKISNYENTEKFRKYKKYNNWKRSGCWHTKIVIFKTQEEKVKFILKWA